jgi:hypothetical protein
MARAYHDPNANQSLSPPRRQADKPRAMGQIEAAGDVVTGALLGRAVEPGAGENHGHGALCLNCGTALAGDFCHRCGQPGHIHRTLHSILHDLLHGVFHFEGKIWHTLPMLALHPGELTRRYIEGERARFVSPLALFLFSVFLLFAAFSWSEGGQSENQVKVNVSTTDAKEAAAQLQDVEKRLAIAEQGLDAAKRAHQDTGGLKIERAQLRATQHVLKAISEGRKPVSGLDQVISAIHDKLIEKDKNSKLAKRLENPELVIYKIKSSMYKFSWALIPISVPFVWLMLAWKPYHAYDHTIFVIYSISAMNLLIVLLTLLSFASWTSWLVPWLLIFGPPVHMFRQLKGAYRLRWPSALWRTVFLLWSAFIAMGIFLTALIALGIFE